MSNIRRLGDYDNDPERRPLARDPNRPFVGVT